MFSLTTSALDGERGTGKTLSLCHIIHFCARQDWLVLHIPDGKPFLSPHRVSAPVTVVARGFHMRQGPARLGRGLGSRCTGLSSFITSSHY